MLGGEERAFLLTRIRQSPDINGDCVVNVDDLIDLLYDFGTEGGLSDINGDGTTDVLDLIDLLLAFGTACP